MSKTPRTDEVQFEVFCASDSGQNVVSSDFARTLELENAELRKENERLQAESETRMLESKMIEHILDDDEGWREAIPAHRCPTMQSAIELRLSFENKGSKISDLTRQNAELSAACAAKDVALLTCKKEGVAARFCDAINYHFHYDEGLVTKALSLTPSNALDPIRQALDAALELAEFHVGSQEKKNSSPSAQDVPQAQGGKDD